MFTLLNKGMYERLDGDWQIYLLDCSFLLVEATRCASLKSHLLQSLYLRQILPKSQKSCRSSLSEIWTLKPPMRVWGAVLSNGECSQTVWWYETHTPSAPEALSLSCTPLWRRWIQAGMEGHARWVEELWKQTRLS